MRPMLGEQQRYCWLEDQRCWIRNLCDGRRASRDRRSTRRIRCAGGRRLDYPESCENSAPQEERFRQRCDVLRFFWRQQIRVFGELRHVVHRDSFYSRIYLSIGVFSSSVNELDHRRSRKSASNKRGGV